MSRQIMVIDYDKCVRYARGDEYLATERVPYRCPVCANGVAVMVKDDDGDTFTADVRYLTPGSFSAKLAPVGEPPKCEDHKTPVEMVRV